MSVSECPNLSTGYFQVDIEIHIKFLFSTNRLNSFIQRIQQGIVTKWLKREMIWRIDFEFLIEHEIEFVIFVLKLLKIGLADSDFEGLEIRLEELINLRLKKCLRFNLWLANKDKIFERARLGTVSFIN